MDATTRDLKAEQETARVDRERREAAEDIRALQHMRGTSTEVKRGILVVVAEALTWVLIFFAC